MTAEPAAMAGPGVRGRAKGTPRTGGRKKGTLNKATILKRAQQAAEREAKIAAGEDPDAPAPKHVNRIYQGRKPGAINRSTRTKLALVEEATRAGMLPLDHFLTVLRDPKQPMHRRDWAAVQAAPYVHPRMQAIAFDPGKPPESNEPPDLLRVARKVALMLELAAGEVEDAAVVLPST